LTSQPFILQYRTLKLSLSDWFNIIYLVQMINLDLHLEIESEGRLRMQIYDKRDDFNFPIVNFLFICSNITAAPAYGLYISQLMRYSIACGSYQDFLERGLLLKRKLLNQWSLLVKVKSSLRKLYRRHHDLVDRYEISVSQMTTDMFNLS